MIMTNWLCYKKDNRIVVKCPCCGYIVPLGKAIPELCPKCHSEGRPS